jgi:hypothetical protein
MEWESNVRFEDPIKKPPITQNIAFANSRGTFDSNFGKGAWDSVP